ncbi:MAG: MarR family transcriptional regulator [Candidatus Saccharibacteria bacterium]
MYNIDLSKITTYQSGATQALVHREIQKICDDILRPYKITKMQWLIIGNVLDAQKKGIRISDLAEKLGTTISFLTTSINLLEARNILKRFDNVSDTRSKLIVVNKQYVPKCQEIETTLRSGLRNTIYGNVDPTEFRIYIKVLMELAHVNDNRPKPYDPKGKS